MCLLCHNTWSDDMSCWVQWFYLTLSDGGINLTLETEYRFLQQHYPLWLVRLKSCMLTLDYCCYFGQSVWYFHVHSSLLLLMSPFLHPASPCTHPGDMAPSRERVSSEETSTCQKKSTSSPSCLPSPSYPSVSHISCAPSLAPITPFFLCYPPRLAIWFRSLS